MTNNTIEKKKTKNNALLYFASKVTFKTRQLMPLLEMCQQAFTLLRQV